MQLWDVHPDIIDQTIRELHFAAQMQVQLAGHAVLSMLTMAEAPSHFRRINCCTTGLSMFSQEAARNPGRAYELWLSLSILLTSESTSSAPI